MTGSPTCRPRGYWLILVLLVAGCAGTPEGPSAPVEDRSAQAPVKGDAKQVKPVPPRSSARTNQPRPARPSAPTNPAVLALMDTAGAQENAGDLSAASAALERALRIEPHNPLLWSRLANLRLEQGDYRQAENLARKSNSLAGKNQAIQARNWQLISQARREQGDTKGARAADERARQMESP